MSKVPARCGALYAVPDTQHQRTDDRLLPLWLQRLRSSLEGANAPRLLFLAVLFGITYFAFGSWLLFLCEFALFAALWSLMLYGLWIGGVYLIHSYFPSAKRSVVLFFALLITFPIVFELIKLFQEEMAVKAALIAQGAPTSCSDSLFSVLNNLFASKRSCLEYYRVVDRSVFWAVNPLKVISSLLLETVVLVSGLLGKSAGLYFTSLMSELPWIYQVPALLFTGFCIVLSLFAYFGYEFRLFWRCIEIGRSHGYLNSPHRAIDRTPLPANGAPKSVTDGNRPRTVAIAGSNPSRLPAGNSPLPLAQSDRPSPKLLPAKDKKLWPLPGAPRPNVRQPAKANELYLK